MSDDKTLASTSRMSGPNDGAITSRRRWRVRIEFKREDAWVGVFWRTEQTGRGRLRTWWICLVPMLPIVVQHVREDR